MDLTYLEDKMIAQAVQESVQERYGIKCYNNK